MFYCKTKNGYLLRLVKGESMLDELTRFCHEHDMKSGYFSAIGAVQEIEFAFYHLNKKEYESKTFTNDHELVSLTGNIAQVDGKPFFHAHGVVAGEDFSCIGGHVKRAVVGATCEVYITPFDEAIERVYDEEVGLKLLNCNKE